MHDRAVYLVVPACGCSLTYYGISLALNGLKGSLYVTFMISAAAEIPSNMLAAWMIEVGGWVGGPMQAASAAHQP
jgi:hypothetical protein